MLMFEIKNTNLEQMKKTHLQNVLADVGRGTPCQ